MNSIFDQVEHAHIQLYADDMDIAVSRKQYKEAVRSMNKVLSKVADHLSYLGLTINTDKTLGGMVLPLLEPHPSKRQEN